MSKIPVFDLPHAVWYNNRICDPRPFDPEAEKYWEAGKVIVSDLLTGVRTAIPADSLVPVAPKNTDIFDIVQAWRDVWLAHYEAESDALTKFDVGALFSIAVGDGSAYYRVTRLTKTKVHIGWLGLCCDEWFARPFGRGGEFRRKDVEQYWSPFRKWQGYNEKARIKMIAIREHLAALLEAYDVKHT